MARTLSAGDKASCSVITRVPSLRTTVTALGTWLPVRRCSKAIAAWAICCAMVALDLLIGLVPPVATVPRAKKTGVAEHPEVFNHAGILVNGPPGMAGLPFS